jgi:outer membrane receptor protein involved in Fe transport
LRDVAGLTQFRRTDARSANATSQGATLRGLGGNASSRALLLLDGVPQTDPFGGWVTWPAFAPNRIERVRVTRGGGSGAYGSGALAGTIEFESLTSFTSHFLSKGNPTALGLSYGSRDSVDADAILAGNLGGGFAFLSANYARGDGFVPIIKSQRGTADIASVSRVARSFRSMPRQSFRLICSASPTGGSGGRSCPAMAVTGGMPASGLSTRAAGVGRHWLTCRRASFRAALSR